MTDGSFEASVYGTIESGVSCKDGKIRVKVVVLPNTTAFIYLPERENEKPIKAGSGVYEYEYRASE